MKTDTTLSRRRLLAGVPAVAAAGVPSVANALGGLAMGGDAELLALKPGFDQVFDEWWQQHLAWEAGEPARVAWRAKVEAEVKLQTGFTHDQGWRLEGDEGEAYRKIWRETYHAAIEAGRVPQTNEEYRENERKIDEENAKSNALIAKILGHPGVVSREGLALQCRAILMDNWNAGNLDETTRWFIASVTAYAGAESRPRWRKRCSTLKRAPQPDPGLLRRRAMAAQRDGIGSCNSDSGKQCDKCRVHRNFPNS
jgi:hypothetical protein